MVPASAAANGNHGRRVDRRPDGAEHRNRYGNAAATVMGSATATASRQDPDADCADYADLSEPREDLTARRRQSGNFLGTAARDAAGASRAALPKKERSDRARRRPVRHAEQSA